MQSSATNESSRARIIALWVLGIATIAGFAYFGVLDSRMNDAGGPGILRFELVADRITAARILDAWGVKGRDAAEQSLWFDFAFLFIYGAFLVLAIRTAGAALARRGFEQLAWLGSWIWWFAVAGAAFDVFEDVALLVILNGNTGRAAPAVATHFAVLKFAVLFNAVLYLIVACIALIRDRNQVRTAAGA